jgi:hypothetical protein
MHLRRREYIPLYSKKEMNLQNKMTSNLRQREY